MGEDHHDQPAFTVLLVKLLPVLARTSSGVNAKSYKQGTCALSWTFERAESVCKADSSDCMPASPLDGDRSITGR